MATKKQVAAREAEDAEDAALTDDIPFEIVDAINPDDVGDLAEVKGDAAIEAVKDVTFVVVKASIDTQRQFEGDQEWACKRLKLEVKVADGGTDGEGKYAGKRFFPSVVVAFPMVTVPADASKPVKSDKRYKVAAGFTSACVDGGRVPDFTALERIHEAAADEGKRQDKHGQRKVFNASWWVTDAQLDFKEFALATGLAAITELQDGTGRKVWKMVAPLDDSMLGILASGDVEFIANVTKSFDGFRQADRNELKRYRAVTQAEAE